MSDNKGIVTKFGNILLFAKVIILNEEDDVLVLRRSNTAPRGAFTWDWPGGILEYGEDPAAAVIRETAEETGIALNDVQILSVASQYADDYIIKFIFKAHVESKRVTLSYEHDRYRWVRLAEIENLDMPQAFKNDARRLAKTLVTPETAPDAFDHDAK